MNEKAVELFGPIPARRAFELVCDRIRELLAAGLLKAGDKLPPERQLSEQLGVSRVAVREALRSLENAGLVVVQRGPRGGAFIRGGNDGKLTELMQDMLDVGAVSLSELTEARVYIVGSAARLACERATEDDLARLEENVRQNEKAASGSFPERLEHATRFYELLARATGNKVMIAVVRCLTDTIKAILQRTQIDPAQRLHVSRRRFLQALQARDGERAAHEIQIHLRELHDHIVKQAASGGASKNRSMTA